MSYDRRSFLRRAGMLAAGATGAALGSTPRPAAAEDALLAPFSWGVASGDPTSSSVVIWTRLVTTVRRNVRWLVSTTPDMKTVIKTGLASAAPSADGTVKVDVTGLPAGTWLYYEFRTVGTVARSIVGRTKTAPAIDSDDAVRFGVVACSNMPAGFFNVYARLAERNDLDAIVHLGDYQYEGGSSGIREPGTVQPAHETVTLDDYRQRYASYRLDPDLRRLHQLYPWITVWDDHESTNNSFRDGAKNHQVETEGAWAVRKAEAQQAYSEWMPLRTVDPSRIYRGLQYGKNVDLLMLDTRLEGRDVQIGTELQTLPSGDGIDDPGRQLISPAQRQWLFDALDASKARARWRVLGQQVMFGHLNGVGFPDTSGVPELPSFGLRRGGNAVNPDQWDGYPAERRRVLQHLRGYDALAPTAPKPAAPLAPANDIQDVVILTGDIHTAWAIDVSEDPYNPLVYNPLTGAGAAAVEFVATSVTSSTLGDQYGEATEAIRQLVLADNPHIKYTNLSDHGYFVLHLDDVRARADFWTVDTVATLSDVESLAASYQAVRGSAGVKSVATPPPTGSGPAPATPGPEPIGSGPVVPELPAGLALPAAAVAVGAATAGVVALRNRRSGPAT